VAVDYRRDRGLVVLTFDGDTTDEEIGTVLATVAADSAVPRRCRLLLDARGSSSLGRRSPDAIRYLVELVSGLGDGFGRRLAVLVAQDVQFGMTRMASAFGDARALDIRAFRDEEEARAWLAESDQSGNVA
jgi:hypothetical protein